MIILLVILVIGLFAFLYSAFKNNEAYDKRMAQFSCLNRYIDSNNIAMLTYMGIDRNDIRQYENVLATITTFEENKVKVTFNGKDVVYANREKFFDDWHFIFED